MRRLLLLLVLAACGDNKTGDACKFRTAADDVMAPPLDTPVSIIVAP